DRTGPAPTTRRRAGRILIQLSSAPVDNRCVRVLVVEDQPKMARLLQRGLRDDGFVTDVCGSGEDALWMAGSPPYDAIVLDVMLPGIDGFETCRRLRADQVWAPILILTARDSVEAPRPAPTGG